MSVLIKGMKMPKNGEITIAFASDENGKNTIALILDSNGNPIEHKGVIEIPTPHGRLIDAEALMISVLDAMKNKTDDSVIGLIDKAPTIIEAEVSDERL